MAGERAITIETVEETGSTNADLLARLGSGEFIEEGYWLQALRQSGGRGRLGRPWQSPTGNLFCSTVVNLRPDDPPPHTLSFVAGLSVAKALATHAAGNDGIMLKWPNDVLVRGAKISGVLLERSGQSVVVGIGINVTHAPDVPDRKTTSIHRESPKHSGLPDEVLASLSAKFGAQLSRWRSEPLAKMLDRWMAAAHPIGAQLKVGLDDSAISGAFAGLDGQGALLLRLANGPMRTIHAGDVSMISEGKS